MRAPPFTKGATGGISFHGPKDRAPESLSGPDVTHPGHEATRGRRAASTMLLFVAKLWLSAPFPKYGRMLTIRRDSSSSFRRKPESSLLKGIRLPGPRLSPG